MRKLSVKLSEKVYVMSRDLNVSISDLIRDSLNYVGGLGNYSIGDVVKNCMIKDCFHEDCFHKRNTSVLITEEHEALLEQASSQYYVGTGVFINSAVELYYTMQINTKKGARNN